jgi:hypothetical protein
VVLAANHTGHLDGAIVLAMAPRPSQFLVLARTFEGFVGHLLRWSGQIPIDQRRGDRRALAQALLVVDFGPPVALDLPDGLPGQARLDLVTERIRATLVAHMHAAEARHGIPLPTDVPPDLPGRPNRRGRAVAPSGLNVT